MARPLKFTQKRKKQFLEMLGNGNTIASICEGLGLTTSAYRKHRLTDPEFAQEVDEVKSLRTHLVEDALYVNALGGNVTAQIFYLVNRRPEDWQSVNKVEAQVKGAMLHGHVQAGQFAEVPTEDLEHLVANMGRILIPDAAGRPQLGPEVYESE